MGIFQYASSCDKCGSSDANAFYLQDDDTIDSTCFSCKAYVKHNTDEATRAAPKQAKGTAFDWAKFMKQNTRKITSAYRVPVALSLEYGLRESVNQSTGEVDTIYYPVTTKGKTTAFQAKRITGDFEKNRKWLTYGKISQGSLFGVNQCKGGRMITIVEGASDCLAAVHMLREQGKAYSVVSIPNGAAGAAKALSGEIPLIDGAEKIVLNFDSDSAGRKGAESCIDILGIERTYLVVIPKKDAQEMKDAGRSKEYLQAIYNAAKPPPAGIVRLEDVIEICLKKPTMGLPWPWEALNKITYGIHPRSLITIGAAPKSGKTDSQFQLVAHLVKNAGQKVAVFNLEDPASKTFTRIAEKYVGQNFHNPEMPFEEESLRSALLKVGPNVMVYDSNGSREWEHIEKTIKYMILEGCKVIILDNLTALVSQYSSSVANDKLNMIMTSLASIRERYGASIISYSHVNPAKTGIPHDFGGPILGSQFTGSRAMQKWSTQGITILRNHHPELPEEYQNLGEMQVILDREYGRTGFCSLKYDYETTLFSETNTRMLVGAPDLDEEKKKSNSQFTPMSEPTTVSDIDFTEETQQLKIT